MVKIDNMKGDDFMALFPRMMPNYLDRVFDDFDVSSRVDEMSKMKCDIYLEDGVYVMEMDIPGFSRDDVKIEIDDNDYLTVTAEKKSESNDDSRNYVRKERFYGKYQRSFYVGEIDKNSINASFSDGILKVTMPKLEEKKSSKMTIDIN